MLCHPYQGDLKQFPNNDDGEPIDEYEIIALAKRLGISIEEMKDMSFISLLNILLSNIDESDTNNGVRRATQEDIDRVFG